MNERLYRTVDDRMMFGVLGGLSLRMSVDPSVVRVIYAVLTVVTGIFPLLIAYVIMAIVIPEAPPGYEAAMRARAVPPAAWGPPGAGSAGEGPAGWPAAPAATTTLAAADPGPAWGDAGADPSAAGPAPVWGAAWDDRSTAGPGLEDRRHGDDTRMGAIVGGLVLVGLGSLFLLVQVVPEVDWGIVGPAALVLLGVVLILGSIRRA